jgi:peptide methionine sulfoxide reductase MsrB
MHATYDVSPKYPKVDQTGVTTFYDTVCGIPLFQAPVGRSFQEWVAETSEHGWPSFRTKEIVAGNSYTNVTEKGIVEVYSSCGTYLGTNLADDSGDRYCMDLSCISGHAATIYN